MRNAGESCRRVGASTHTRLLAGGFVPGSDGAGATPADRNQGLSILPARISSAGCAKRRSAGGGDLDEDYAPAGHPRREEATASGKISFLASWIPRLRRPFGLGQRRLGNPGGCSRSCWIFVVVVKSPAIARHAKLNQRVRQKYVAWARSLMASPSRARRVLFFRGGVVGRCCAAASSAVRCTSA